MDDRVGEFAGLVQQLRRRVPGDRLVCGDGTQLTLQPSAFLLGLVDPFRDLHGVGARVERGTVLVEALVAGGKLLAESGSGRVLIVNIEDERARERAAKRQQGDEHAFQPARLVEGQRAAGWREALNELAEAYPGRIS